MEQKSWPSGAPSRAAPANMALIPGTTSISTSSAAFCSFISHISEAMPYTPESPLLTTATVFPSLAISKAATARSRSFFMPVPQVSFSPIRVDISFRYSLYPTITSEAPMAATACGVICSLEPGPIPTTYILLAIA